MPLSVTGKANIIINQLCEEMMQHWINLKQPGDKETVINIAAWMRHFTADFIAVFTAEKRMSFMKYYYQKLKNEPLTEEILDNEKFIEKRIDPSLKRPMTDDEIRGLMVDAYVAGTDT
ncbi:222_t:CDS:2, partial [Paraglomus occultum]